MRRGVWVVLGLVGFAPVGALAQQGAPAVGGSGQTSSAPSGSTGQSDSAPQATGSGQVGTPAARDSESLIIIEMPARGERRASDTARGQRPVIRPDSATGGSGVSPSQPQERRAPDEQEFLVGTVRSVAGGRLLMVDPSHRVYEFDLSEQTRLIGPDGAPLPLQPLPEGTQVMTVTQGGEVRDRVLTLQVLVNPLQSSP
jgi:hypothetical protein